MKMRRVFAWPAALGVLSLFALITGLLGEGWFNLACWAGLAAPIAAAIWAWVRRRRRA